MNGLLYDLVLEPFEMVFLKDLRKELLSHAHGRVLEIGSGTGLNFPLYPKNVEVVGIDPDDSMREKSLKKAQTNHVTVKAGDAMKLDFGNEEFDTVVATLVFCTIPDPKKALEEVYRILKPGGTLLLMEHVRINTPVIGRMMDVLTPLWVHLASGCHLDRDPTALIESLGFQTQDLQVLLKGLGKVWVLKKPEYRPLS